MLLSHINVSLPLFPFSLPSPLFKSKPVKSLKKKKNKTPKHNFECKRELALVERKNGLLPRRRLGKGFKEVEWGKTTSK